MVITSQRILGNPFHENGKPSNCNLGRKHHDIEFANISV